MLAGRTVLERTLATFAAHPAVDSIVVVVGAEEQERVRTAVSAFPKVVAVVPGGETRAESVRHGLNALPDGTEIALVHDAARPLVSTDLIDRVIQGTIRFGAAVPGLPLSDTVKRVDADGLIRSTIPRTALIETSTDQKSVFGLTAVQTPQGVRVALLRAAYERSERTSFGAFEPTDEASLVENYGASVLVVPGDAVNIKITRPEDVALAEWLIAGAAKDFSAQALHSSEAASASTPALALSTQSPPTVSAPDYPEIRTGFGYDVHAFAPPSADRKLFLGGIEIAHDRGLEGHSDADVLLHAVCDALLGAASLGDIGILFPNTDNAYKGISSLRLLGVVSARLAEAGWRVVNVDATVVAESPRLMPHRIEIQETIADCLKVEPGRISVKATTAEKLGFVGRSEGIEASAVATIVSV